MSDLVTIDIHPNGVADVRLNRPDKYNALSPEMFDAITAAGESLVDNPAVRAVVLSGNGKGFCAGLDFSGFKGMAGEGNRRSVTGLAASRDRPENAAQRPGLIWKEVPVPVIAAIHGVAFGGGFQISMGPDIRIAAPDAQFSVMEIKWGLIPDMSITQTLRDLVRLDVAKELTFTGRVFRAPEAAELGIVTKLADNPLDAALEMAETIAGKSPDAVRSAKRLLETSWRADAATGLKMEANLQGKLIGSKNQVEAVKANFEKRAPVFADPVADEAASLS